MAPPAKNNTALIVSIVAGVVLLCCCVCGVTGLVFERAGKKIADAVASAAPTPSGWPTGWPTINPGLPSANPNDPDGQQACVAVRSTMGKGGSDVDPDSVLPLAAQAEKSTNSDISSAGTAIKAQAEKTKKALGSSTESASRLQLLTKLLTLQTACLKAGY